MASAARQRRKRAGRLTVSGSDESAIGLAALRLKFARHDQTLSRLMETDPVFRRLCADYGAALIASDRHADRTQVAHQFRCMAAEIEVEIVGILKTLGGAP